jgi:archaellum biogenesis ATPase FlaH
LKHISTLKDGDISLIRGGPGTGKSYTILLAAEMIIRTGNRVSIVFPNEKTLKNFVEQIDTFPI